VKHCFEYLRQALICNADTTLEGLEEDNSGVNGWGTMHQCCNFNAVLEWTRAQRATSNGGIE
jgi:hypothetical protein